MKRRIRKSTKRRLIRPIVIGAFALAALATYKLSTLEAGSPAEAAILAPAYVEPTSTDRQQEVKPAPEFTLKDLTGNEVNLSDYRGKVVVLNFWATWCPPCRKEIPDFNELQKQYGDRGLQFIGIALDERGAEVVKKWVAQNPVDYPVLIGDQSVRKSYGDMAVIPVTILIDRQGNIRTKYIGLRQKAIVESMIVPLLADR
jgi:peroxiredoxin